MAITAISWDDVVGVTAVVGAVTGISGLVLSLMNYNRDKPKLKVQLEWSKRGVSASNIGRRPIEIQKVYVEDDSGYTEDFSKNLPHRLNEGERFLADQPLSEIFDQAQVRATVVDGRGRSYRTSWERRKERERGET